jgi:hypothetical protein
MMVFQIAGAGESFPCRGVSTGAAPLKGSSENHETQRKARKAEGIPGFLAFDFLCVSVVNRFFLEVPSRGFHIFGFSSKNTVIFPTGVSFR